MRAKLLPPTGFSYIFLVVCILFILSIVGLSIPQRALASRLAINAGGCAEVYGSNSAGGLKVRSCAGTNCSQVGSIYDGTIVRITGGPTNASGYTWWQHDHGGWSAANWLRDASCSQPGGNIYVASDIELQPDPNHGWPPVEGDKLIGRFTLGNNGGQNVRVDNFGIRMRRNNDPNDYWDFLAGYGVDLSPGQTVRFDQNNERQLSQGHYRAEIIWQVGGNWHRIGLYNTLGRTLCGRACFSTRA